MVGDGNVLLDGGALSLGSLYLADDVGVIYADDGLHRCPGISIYDIMLCQHVGCRNDDGTDFVECQHDDPPLVASLQNQHHGVVLADAQRQQIGGSLIRLFLQLCEGGAYLLALVVGP